MTRDREKRITTALTLAILLVIGGLSMWTIIIVASGPTRQEAPQSFAASGHAAVASSSASSSPSSPPSALSSSTNQATTAQHPQMRESTSTLTCSSSRVSYPPPVLINYSSSASSPSRNSPPGGSSDPSLPGLTYFGDQSVLVSTNAPLSLATNSSGYGYGLFYNGTGYYLAVSGDFVHWNTTSTFVIPKGYQIAWGNDLGVARSGLILVSATRLVMHQNFTIFRASHDHGRSFQTVLNVSLSAKLQNYTHLNSGPGEGFWHGVAEAGNGDLFVGLYNPQGLIFRSTDGGMDWQVVFNASSHSDWHNEIHDVEVDPKNDYVYATADDEAGSTRNQSVWVSTDYGDHWAMVYSAMSGGAGLPLHMIPTSIGFLDGGRLVVVGLEGSPQSQYSRTVYILRVEPSGCLQAAYRIDASQRTVDPFISWSMHPRNESSVFVLTHSAFSVDHTLGVGLFALGDKGGLTTLMTLKGENAYSLVFLQMIGPDRGGYYAILASANNHVFLLSVRYPPPR